MKAAEVRAEGETLVIKGSIDKTLLDEVGKEISKMKPSELMRAF